MGIFFTASRPVLPVMTAAFRDSLLVDPKSVPDIDKEAAQRVVQVAQAISPQFNTWRFVGALAIAAALLAGAIWTSQHNLPDISKTLLNSFSGFGAIVLGLIGGEAQKSASG